MINRTLIITLITAAFGLAGTSPARAAGACAKWYCGDNGTQLTGIAVPALKVDGIEPLRVDVVLQQNAKAK
jgi:hypothetical protein